MVILTPKKRKKIYSLIGREGIKLVAEKFEVTEGYVRMIIAGKRNNIDILEYVVQLAEEKSHKLDEKLHKIKLNISKL